MKNIYFVCILLGISGCFNQRDFALKNEWKHYSGYSTGDFIQFDKIDPLYKIDSNNIIYKKEKPVARLKSVSRRELTIVSEDNEIGIYVIIGEHLEK